MNSLLASMGSSLHDEVALTSAEARLLGVYAVRLLVAVVLGGVLGLEREWAGKIAGLRTHMLTALGAALFVLAAEQSGMDRSDLSRVIQGVVAGIGFLGGGVILKHGEDGRVHGITTAAGIWLTAAIGIAAGTGRLWLAVLATALAVAILVLVRRLERWVNPEANEGLPPKHRAP